LIAYLCEIDNLSVKTNIFLTKAFTGWSFNSHLFIVPQRTFIYHLYSASKITLSLNVKQ
jgi:hypothetical protein